MRHDREVKCIQKGRLSASFFKTLSESFIVVGFRWAVLVSNSLFCAAGSLVDMLVDIEGAAAALLNHDNANKGISCIADDSQKISLHELLPWRGCAHPKTEANKKKLETFPTLPATANKPEMTKKTLEKILKLFSQVFHGIKVLGIFILNEIFFHPYQYGWPIPLPGKYYEWHLTMQPNNYWK